MRFLLLGLGWLSLALGLAGIFLPLLPTTPFLLLTSACFLRSSPRLHRRMLADARVGPLLAQWESDRSIPRRAKWKANILIVVSFGISIVLIEGLPQRCILVLIATGLLIFLARLRTREL